MCGPKLGPLEDRSDDQTHLELRKRGADAAAYPAAERDPAVGIRRLMKETLGPELVGIGIQILTEVDRRELGSSSLPAGMQ